MRRAQLHCPRERWAEFVTCSSAPGLSLTDLFLCLSILRVAMFYLQSNHKSPVWMGLLGTGSPVAASRRGTELQTELPIPIPRLHSGFLFCFIRWEGGREEDLDLCDALAEAEL